MQKLKAEGVCLYCKETKAGAGISRHLTSHLKKIEQEKAVKKTAYHLKVSAGSLYFLHLLVHENLTLSDLDNYLRAIWLECCGHMSSFDYKGQRTGGGGWFDEEEFGIKQGKTFKSVFKGGKKLTYEYDFGSTTRLDIQVVNEYKIDLTEAGILLLSRNEPLKLLCSNCGEKPAASLCSVCYEDNLFCADCAETHEEECEDFADYAAVSIVNSPRTGVCAYDGGMIDTERDGVWQK